MKKVLLFLLLLFESCSPAFAAQNTAKSTGLTPVGEIESFDDVQTQLIEIKRALDVIHRQLLGDIDSINRDEIPDLQSQIDGIGSTAVDFDIPLTRNLNFRYLATNKIQWDEGTLEYGGTSYTVSSGSSNEDDIAAYVDVSSLSDPITLGTTATATVVDDRWYLAWRTTTTVYAALQSPIIHGGLVQANTITADQIAVDTITANEINTDAITADEIAANAITVGNMDATALGRIFISNTKKTTVEAWEEGSTTYIGAGNISLTSGASDIVLSDMVLDYIDWDHHNPAGLYMTDIYMGFWHPTPHPGDWLVYFQNNGNFQFGGVEGNQITWDGMTLDIRGSLVAEDITAGTISTDRLVITDLGTVSTADLGDGIINGKIVYSDPVNADTKVELYQGYVGWTQEVASAKYAIGFVGEGYYATVAQWGAFFENLIIGDFNAGNFPTTSGNSVTKGVFLGHSSDIGGSLQQACWISVFLSGAAGDKASISAANDNSTHFIEHFDIEDCDLDSACTVPASTLTGANTLPAGTLPAFGSGTYVGDGGGTKAITHGLGRTPVMVLVTESTNTNYGTQLWAGGGSATITSVGGSTFTVNTGTGTSDLNANTKSYHWIAF